MEGSPGSVWMIRHVQFGGLFPFTTCAFPWHKPRIWRTERAARSWLTRLFGKGSLVAEVVEFELHEKGK